MSAIEDALVATAAERDDLAVRVLHYKSELDGAEATIVRLTRELERRARHIATLEGLVREAAFAAAAGTVPAGRCVDRWRGLVDDPADVAAGCER